MIWDSILVWFAVLTHSCHTHCAKIGILPIQMKSHLIEMKPIAEALIAHNHHVSLIVSSRYKDEQQLQLASKGIKLQEYEYPETEPSYYSTYFGHSMQATLFPETVADDHEFRGKSPLDVNGKLSQLECEFMMKDVNFLKQITEERFDLFLVEDFALCRCQFILPHYLGIPYVSYHDITDFFTYRIPFSPSFTPLAGFPLPFAEKMAWWERFVNTFAHVSILFWTPFPAIKNLTLLDMYKTDESVTTWDDLARAALITFIPQDVVLENRFPTLPHVIYIGPISLKPAKTLPDELESFMDKHQTVIVVSLGSILGNLPRDFNKKLYEALAETGYGVVWKNTAADVIDEQPKRIKMMSWIPQSDLLGHPKVKAFVTHCGTKGQYEALYHGVPMVGIPFFGDQLSNCRRADYRGYGVCVSSYTSFTVTELANEIRKVVQNESFTINTRKASAILRSRPQTASQIASFGMEHVIAHGAEHMRSEALRAPLWQFLALDSILVLCVIGFVLMHIPVIGIRLLWKCISKLLGRKTPYGKKTN